MKNRVFKLLFLDINVQANHQMMENDQQHLTAVSSTVSHCSQYDRMALLNKEDGVYMCCIDYFLHHDLD